jgi:CubicO group peptidase (beta-lactamase class C family)
MDRETNGAQSVQGTVAPGFEAAREAFTANFARAGDYQEVGASFAAFHRGRCVVDLWGGTRDRARQIPWTKDTLINVWSSTKGVTATAVAMLVDRGQLSYEDKVAKHWPEFAANGKENITVAQIMSHRAGLNGFAEPTTIEDMFDWKACVAKLARQKPAWPPGTASSYHAMTYGWLAGEIARRISGKSLGTFVRDEIGGPLGADVFVGLSQSEERRVAEMIGPLRAAPTPPLSDVAMLALVNPQQNPEAPNGRAWRAAEIPAANGQASAMGLARVYAALAGDGSLDGKRLLAPATIKRMTAPMTANNDRDALLGFVDSWAMGVILNTPGVYGPNKRAFGHSGWGGSFGCADPDAQVSIGYVCNQMGPDLVGDPRTAELCSAVLSAA